MKKLLKINLLLVLFVTFVAKGVFAYEHKQYTIKQQLGSCAATFKYHYNTTVYNYNYDSLLVVDNISGNHPYQGIYKDYCTYYIQPVKVATSLYSTSKYPAYIEKYNTSSSYSLINGLKVSVGVSTSFSNLPLSLGLSYVRTEYVREGKQYAGYRKKTVGVTYPTNARMGKNNTIGLNVYGDRIVTKKGQKIVTDATVKVCAINVAYKGPNRTYCKLVDLVDAVRTY